MKSKYKPYPSYKDSGIAWLGEVPIGWDVRRLKTILQERKEKNSPVKTKDILSLCMYRGVIPYSEKGNSGNKAKDDLTAYKLAYPNDIVLNSMNVVAGSVGLSKYFGAVSPVYYMLYPRKLTDDISYFNAIFQSESFQKSLIGLGNGILVKQSEKTGKLNTIRMKISMDSLNDVLMPIPPFQEQQTIANYLDNATAKIDTLIEKQTKLIELLKEKRQAVISTAVTRGLDNTVAMKDSGLEWLGEIPEHWEVKKLKFIAYAKPSNVDKKLKDGEKDVLLCNYTDVYYNDFITNDIEFMKATATNEQIKKFTLNVDDVIITKDSEGPEDIAIATCVKEVQDNLVCGYHLTHIKPTKCNGRYLFRAFNSDGIHDQFKVAANGITRYGIGVYGIDNSFFPAPPMKEQEEIANYIDDKTSKIDTLISKASKAIELLKERRTALISAVVTGKIDVRKAS